MQICVRTKVSQTARAPILCPLAPLLSALPSRGSTEVRERAIGLPGWSPSRATGRHLARHLRSLRTAANTSGIHIPPYIIRYPRRLKVSGSGGGQQLGDVGVRCGSLPAAASMECGLVAPTLARALACPVPALSRQGIAVKAAVGGKVPLTHSMWVERMNPLTSLMWG